MSEIPDTTYVDAGTGLDESLLGDYLQVVVSPKRGVLLSEDVASDDPNGFPESRVYLGDKSGRSVILKFKDFDSAAEWFNARKGLKPVLEVHREDEIYEPVESGVVDDSFLENEEDV